MLIAIETEIYSENFYLWSEYLKRLPEVNVDIVAFNSTYLGYYYM